MLQPIPRIIVHADLDAFYASVEQMDNPALRGKPVLVGGSPQGRGVVAACSYEARKFGVRSAMPMGAALRRCPHAVVVRPRFDRYHELSQQVMALLGGYSPLLEPLSLDEAYLDVTALGAQGHAPEDLAREIKRRVKTEIGLVISLGVGPSKSVAKIASGKGKPDGLVLVPPGTEREFLAPLPVRDLSGVGPRSEERLVAAGIKTLGDLASASEAWLEREFGKRGPELGRMARGLDDRPVSPQRDTKSVSAETTFPQDIGDAAALEQALARLSERVGQRLQQAGLPGRTATLKLRFSDFTTLTRSATQVTPIGDAAALLAAATPLLRREMAARPAQRYRLLGVGVSNFTSERQLPLLPLP